jgi:hypothetical protein
MRNGLSCSAQGHAEPDGNLAAGHLCRVAPGVLLLPEGAAPLALLAFTVKNGLIRGSTSWPTESDWHSSTCPPLG